MRVPVSLKSAARRTQAPPCRPLGFCCETSGSGSVNFSGKNRSWHFRAYATNESPTSNPGTKKLTSDAGVARSNSESQEAAAELKEEILAAAKEPAGLDGPQCISAADSKTTREHVDSEGRLWFANVYPERRNFLDVRYEEMFLGLIYL